LIIKISSAPLDVRLKTPARGSKSVVALKLPVAKIFPTLSRTKDLPSAKPYPANCSV